MLQDAAMLMLDEDEEFWQDEYDAPVMAPSTTAGQDAAVKQKPPPGRESREPGRVARAADVNLDKFLAGMPGVGMLPESEMLDEMLVSILHTPTLRSPFGMRCILGSADSAQQKYLRVLVSQPSITGKNSGPRECMLADTAADT